MTTDHYYLVNLTPHTVHLLGPMNPESCPLPIESEGVARAEELTTNQSPIRHDYFRDAGMHVDVPLVTKRFGAVTGLPDPKPHTLYIVSTVVQAACPERKDLVAPHDVVRDDAGRVIGCRAFALLG